MLLIGIDEAGYGPTLGPLCHGYSAFRCPCDQRGQTANSQTAGNWCQSPLEAPDLWAMLHPAVTRHPASGNSIAVDDSKKVYSSGLGLDLLAQGVSAFLECAAEPLGPEDTLYQRLLPAADRMRLEEDPWGHQWGDPADRPRAQTALLGHTLKAKSIAVLAIGARALPAKHFNAALSGRDNKAEASWRVIAAELQRLLALCADGENIHVTIDRQGGRKFYAAQLGALFPGSVPWVESEKPDASVYRIEADGRTVRIEFLVNAESNALPVALASMAAKLARELCMLRLNVFFQRHMPDLEPTAGYAADARRFLRETKALRKKLGIADSEFVRIK